MAKDDKGLTPMMKQFFSMKAQHPGALMLFWLLKDALLAFKRALIEVLLTPF